MIVSPHFAGRRYAVLGLARTGLAVVRSLLESGAHVLAWDSRDEPRQTVANAFGERVELADPVTADLTGYDGVVVSPGVPINRHPIGEAAARFGVPVIGDIELFAQARSSQPAHRVVGITGTNGKSTTTALVHHLLQSAGVPSMMGGNIGLPVLGEEPLPADPGHKRIHWILGGLPKGDDLDECAPWFGNVAAAYTIGDAGPRFAELLESAMPVHRAEMMSEAIRHAIEAARPGDVVLLSPACASFDQFRDYEARGQAFRQIVAALLDGADTPGDAG